MSEQTYLFFVRKAVINYGRRDQMGCVADFLFKPFGIFNFFYRALRKKPVHTFRNTLKPRIS